MRIPTIKLEDVGAIWLLVGNIYLIVFIITHCAV